MSDTIDRLDIEIQAQASNAVAELDRLYEALDRIANALNASAGAFTNVQTAVRGTSRAMRSLAKINLPNLTTITQQLDTLSQMDMGNVGLGSTLANASNEFMVLDRTSTEAGHSMSLLTPITEGIKTAFNGLIDVVKGVASGIGSTASFIVSHFTMIGRAATRLSSIKSIMSGILGPLIGFYGVRSLIYLAKDAVELSSNLTEVQNVVDHAFGTEGAKAIEDFVSTSREEFGLAELAAKQYSSRFQAMGKSMGITADMVGKAHETLGNRMVESYRETGDEMGAMAINLTKLTADMASFYNVEQDTMAQAMNAIYTGQTRPLRQYGIDLTQATLAEWAMKQGLDADFQSMTQAEKAMLRYQYVMAQTSMVQGDFTRTADTFANKVRLLKQNFQALGSTIGGVVINVFKPLITWLNNAMSSVMAFAETIANALGKIFGWTIRREMGGGGGDSGAGDLTSDLDAVGDAADGAGGSLGNANEKAKELKRTLLGFDEINKLNDISDAGGSGSGGGGGGSGGGGGGGGGGASAGDFSLVKTETIFDKFDSDIQSLFGLGKKISDVLSDAMESIDWQSVYKKARQFGSGLAEFLNGLISPRLFRNLGNTIAGAINTVLNAKDAFLDRFNFKNLGYSLAAGINGFFETWDAGLSAKVFYKTINGIVDSIWAAADKTEWGFIGTKISTCVKEALEGIEWEQKVYPAAEKVGSGLAEFMNGLFKPDTFSTVADTIAKMLGTALRTLTAWARDFKWDSFGNSLGAGLRTFFVDKMNWRLTASTFTKLARGIVTAAEEAIDTFANGNGFYVLGRKISYAIRSIPWENLLASAGRVLWKAFNAAIDTAKGMFSNTPFEDALGKIQEIANGIADEINFDALADGLQAVLDVGSKFGAGFLEGFTGAMGVLADIGVGVLTGIGVAIQIIAGALNKLDPDLVKRLGEALGIVAAAFVTMKITSGVAATISGVVGALSGATVAATGASTAVAAAGGAAGGASLTFGQFLGSLLTSTGAIEGGLIGAVMLGTQKLAEMEDSARGGNGKLSEMGFIMGEIGNSFSPKMRGEIFSLTNELEDNGATVEEAASAFAEYFTGKHVDPSKIYNALTGVRGNLNTTVEQEELVALILEKMGEDAKTTFSGMETDSKKAEGAFDNIGKKAEGADEKTGGFSTGIAGFVGGILAQTITMALMGKAYGDIGDKAEGAQTPIDNLKTKIGEMVDSIKTNAATAKTDSKDLAGNIVDTFIETISDASKTVPNATKIGFVNPLTGTMENGFGIHSPSTVMKGYGENIVQGLADGITSRASIISTAIQGIIKTLSDSMTTFVNSAKKYGSDAATKIKEGLESVSMPDIGNNIYKAMSGRSSTGSGSFYTAGQNIATAVKNGANSVDMPNLGSKLVDAMGRYANHGSDNPFYTFGARIAKAFADGIKSVTATLSYKESGTQGIIVGGKLQTVKNYRAVWEYAQGGFPNYGELFVANEAGPEMIGKMGQKNVVANNMQIAEGIEAAVVNGMMKAASAGLFGGSDGTPMVLNATIKTPDGDVLARVVEKAQARRNARYQLTTVY